MSKEEALGPRLLARLDEATDRNRQVLQKSERAKEKLGKNLPTLSKVLQGNQIALAAIREVYGALEADGEELQTVIVELKEAKDLLDVAKSLLEQAGFDFANIQVFSQEQVWLSDHPPTIKRALEIFNLSKVKQALKEIAPTRLEELRAVFGSSLANQLSEAAPNDLKGAIKNAMMTGDKERILSAIKEVIEDVEGQ